MSAPAPAHFSALEWSAYLDGELPPARRDLLRQHLADCPDCSAILKSFQMMQGGAEALARQPVASPPHLRTRVVAVGTAVVMRDWSRRRWLQWLAIGLVVVVAGVLAGAVLIAIKSTPPPGGVSARVRLSIGHVLITRYFVEPPSLEYDVKLRNDSGVVLKITKAIAEDPVGHYEYVVTPPFQLQPGEVIDRIFARPVGENVKLLPGRYRLILESSAGPLTAEITLPTP